MYVYKETEYSKTECMHPQPHVCNLCTGNKKQNEIFELVNPTPGEKHIFCALYVTECFAEQEITAVWTNPLHTPLQFPSQSAREPLFLTDCECCTVLLPSLRLVYGSCPRPTLSLSALYCLHNFSFRIMKNGCECPALVEGLETKNDC